MAISSNEMARLVGFQRKARPNGPPQVVRIAARRGLLLASAVCGLLALPGCRLEDQLMTQPQTAAKVTTAPTESTDTDRLGKGCELKNVDGTGSCEDGRGEMARKSAAPASANNFDPADCQRSGFAAVGMVNGLFYSGQLGAFQAFCKAQEAGQAAAPVPQSSRPTAQKGGGCEWRGSSYAPGDTIYPTEGPILSQDLFINGQSFDQFTGKPGPWQMCECQVSVGHWGCV